MQVILISGLSGSGKSVAIKVLEDSNFYCVDNLPVKLFAETVDLLSAAGHENIAISIDARGGESVGLLPQRIEALKARGMDVRLFFLDATDDTLIRRFAETRRRHPLATDQATLEEAIVRERELLSPVAEAGHRIDTSGVHPNTLRTWIKDLLQAGHGELSLLFESFGYKQGIPLDADYVFDVRCLPNPFYDPKLRALTGQDAEVMAFLERDASVQQMLEDIQRFITTWLPAFRRDNRAYLTVSICCTGGQHRSVFLAERLARHFRSFAGAQSPVLVRHRQLSTD